MSDVNRNAWWGRLLARQLQAIGVRHVFLCPGNRNVPLVFACARMPGWHIHVHQEERSAAFAALGTAKATGLPAVICTTSGSAVANCLPAVCEAKLARVPLIVVSSDRPPELHGCEAPQAMPQEQVFGEFLDQQILLDPPDSDPTPLRQIRQLARLGGPAQLNVQLRDPLPPLPDPGWSSPTDPDWLGQLEAEQQVHRSQDRITGLTTGMRGLIVAGPRCPLTWEAVDRLARETGYPVIADAASGLRRPGVHHLVTSADALCAGIARDWQAELIIRLGPAPVARPVYEFLQAQECRVIRIDQEPVPGDFCHERFDQLIAPTTDQLTALARACQRGSASWCEQWLQADQRAEQLRQQWLDARSWNELHAVASLLAEPSVDFIHLGNSLAVRHANLHLRPGAPLTVYANRGVNGIDGTIATFLGECLARPSEHGLLLCGDLSFLHDLPALALAASVETKIRANIVVVNNHGGAIFDLLPVADDPDYRSLIRTPSGIDIAASAAQFGLAHQPCSSFTELDSALADQGPGVRIVELLVGAESIADPYRELLHRLGKPDEVEG